MRTRRSPRNQERLFKALFKAQDAPVVPAKPARVCGNCAHYKGLRQRGICHLKGIRLAVMEAPGCFTARN